MVWRLTLLEKSVGGTTAVYWSGEEAVDLIYNVLYMMSTPAPYTSLFSVSKKISA